LKKHSSLFGSFLLLLSAMIWGFAFVTQKQTTESLGALTVTCLRSALAVLILIPVILIFDRLKGQRRLFSVKEGKFVLDITRTEWIGGLLCGIFLGLASYLQQLGIGMNGSAGKTAFITALYVAFVPVLGIFIRRRTVPIVWLGVGGALLGGYFLAVPAGEGYIPEFGDLIILVSAVLFAVHILVIDRFSPHCDGVRMSLVQFLTVAILFAPFFLIFEKLTFSALMQGLLPLLYLGFMSSGVAFTLQIVAQGKTHPAVASVLLSLESVFGVVGGALVFGETMSAREYLGCGIMLASVLITELGGVLFQEKKK